MTAAAIALGPCACPCGYTDSRDLRVVNAAEEDTSRPYASLEVWGGDGHWTGALTLCPVCDGVLSPETVEPRP